jgi:hypothetical protein
MMSRYYSETVLSFSVLIDGRRKRIAFSPLTNGGSVYTTADIKEIKVLESLGSYGKTFVRMGGVEAAEKAVPPPPTTEEIRGVTNYQAAVEYLIANRGLKKSALRTPDQILAAASGVGVSFPDIAVG